MADVLKEFLACSWRGIVFPTASADTEIAHDLAIHKKMDRDGANVEATGKNPITFTIRAIFLNTIDRSDLEQTEEPLFPDIYTKFLAAVEDRSTGDFVHPFHGKRRCKVVRVTESFAAQNRGGPSVSVTFIETDEGADNVTLTSTSNLAIMKEAAIDLDAFVKQFNPPLKTGLEDIGFQAFSDFVDAVAGAVGQAELWQDKVASKINAVTNGVNKMNATADRAADLIVTNPITGAIENAKALGPGITKIRDTSNKFTNALYALQSQPIELATDVLIYNVYSPITISALCLITKNKINELMALNPFTLRGFFIPRDTKVKYFKK